MDTNKPSASDLVNESYSLLLDRWAKKINSHKGSTPEGEYKTNADLISDLQDIERSFSILERLNSLTQSIIQEK